MSAFSNDDEKNTRDNLIKMFNENEVGLSDISQMANDSSESSAPSQKPEKMEEIYSTKDKHVKYKNLAPIEEEAAQKRKEEAKQELIDGKMEFSLDEARPDFPEVSLEAELSPDTVVSEEIIEDVRDLKNLRGIYVQDIDDIDISLDPQESVRKYEKKASDKRRYHLRRTPGTVSPSVAYFSGKVVSKVPVYTREAEVNKIPVKAGRFTDVVESEYDEYLRSSDPTISKNYHAMYQQIKPKQSLLITLSQMAQKHREEQKAKEERRKAESETQENAQAVENFDEEAEAEPIRRENSFLKFFRVLFAVIGQSFVSSAKNIPESPTDYESREDLKYVEGQIKGNIKKLRTSLILSLVFTALLFWLAVIERIDKELIFTGFFEEGPLSYVITNLLLLLGAGIAMRSYIFNGLKPLSRFKGNCDTTLSLAYCACLVQNLIALFTADSFAGGDNHLYSFIPLLALSLNLIGRLLMAYRVKGNFGFISSQTPAYAAKIYNDSETARRMISGTTASKGVIAYQHPTSFLSDFLKISYAPDPSEELAGKITPITIVSSVFVAIAYAFIFKNVAGVFSALSVMLCVSIPFSALLAGNLPLALFSKKMKGFGAMVAGYPSVRQFCDTDSFMVNASKLFPKGSVKLKALNATREYRVEESLVAAAMVLREADSPLAPVFDDLVEEYAGLLPKVESVMYEDKSGLVGWVGGERILIGNMTLMNRYHITVPEKAQSVSSGDARTTYFAVSGQLCCVALVTYKANPQLAFALEKAQKNGMSVIVSTTDANITADLIAKEYRMFYRCVKVVPTGYAAEIDETTGKTEDTSRAYLATRGKFSSLVRAVAGCIGLRSNLTLGIVVSTFGIFLGVLLCATMVLYATVARLSIVEMILYILFWLAATFIAELVRRP
ncbi:MAG: hypothetical protein IJH32_11390 [Ruminococcus sp.]|nr:hypothetical protein [Ruminococcus sp.]